MSASAKLVFAVVVCALLAACKVSALDNAVVKEVGFETLWQGGYGVYAAGGNFVIKSEADWREGWEVLPAAIDFDDDMLIAVFMGERNTGGYAIEIITVLETPEHLEVRLEHTAPGKGALVIQALTQPHHIIRLGKSDKMIIFTNHDKER